MSQKALYDQENEHQWQNSWNYGQSEVKRCEKAPILPHFSFLSHVIILLPLKHNTDLNVFLSVYLLCFFLYCCFRDKVSGSPGQL